MEQNSVLIPIKKKIDAWIYYEQNRPKSDCWKNEEEHDNFRKANDLDCILTGGNLHADTIISLTFYLRQVLYHIWNGKKVWNNSEYIPSKEKSPDEYWKFMKTLSDDLKYYLPEGNCLVKKLSKLFEYGQEKANVMILPERWLQQKGKKPYFDYMPHFLYECFQRGKFSSAFEKNDEILKEWIRKQHLDMFFKVRNDLSKENIIDLNNTGNIKSNYIPDMNIEKAIDNCIEIIKARKEYF